MTLYYDPRELRNGYPHLRWLQDAGARPLGRAGDAPGFLFAGARPTDDYARLVRDHPAVLDRPADRAPLLRLDTVLDALAAADVRVPMPRTWRLRLDDPLPADLAFPLFVRTATTSWKLGGRVSRVRNLRELEDEATALRRAFGWDADVLVRKWLDLAPAGTGVYGPIPQEVRVWVVDGRPFAWSFHYLNVLTRPAGFPPTADDLATLADYGRRVGTAFRSRLVVADFARLAAGGWAFIEAGPGSCAGTAHERVFEAVAGKLAGVRLDPVADTTGGTFRE